MIELAIFDVAGTTVSEKGTVYRVLGDTVRALGADPAPDRIEAWMGASKREAITGLLEEAGRLTDDTLIDAAFADFRERITTAYREDPPVPFDGVPETFAALRASGIKVALTTGFDRGVITSLLETIGWDDSVLDAVVCIDDVSTGRPAPYMIFRAMELTGTVDTRTVLVAGDTPRDVEAGRNARAAEVIAVTTGEVSAETLTRARPTHVLGGVVEIPALLSDTGQPVPVPVTA